VDWLTAAFMLIRREAFDDVGGFDEHQWLYGEDLDLGWRLAQKGWHSRYEPAATVRHEHSAAALKAFGSGLDARMTTATYAWMLRRRGVLRTRLAAALQLIEASARWGVLSVLAAHDTQSWSQRRAAAAGNVRAHRIGLQPRRRLQAYR
jgi:GT2 family glycosyltransferase